MEKINIVMIVLNGEYLERATQNLNFDKVNLTAIITDSDEKTFKVGDEEIPINSFSNASKLVKDYKEFIWLIVGYEKCLSEVLKMKKFLMTLGLPERNIVNFELSEQINSAWLANLRYIEENGADFFATGNEYVQSGLDLNLIPCAKEDKAIAKGGINLADAYQDLRQSYLTAKHVFAHVAPNTIKFVLIGLAPDSFRYDNAKDFPHCTKNFQYVTVLNSEPNFHDNLLKDLVSENFAAISEQADLNFDAIKDSFKGNFSLKAVVNWDRDKKSLPADSVENNVQILKDYIKLCRDNGAEPVGIVFPLSPPVRKIYDKEILNSFRETLNQLEKDYEFKCVDWFDHIIFMHFSDMMNLNPEGSLYVNAVISMKLNTWKLIPDKSFCDMNYNYFHHLALTADKDEYNALMKRVFKASAQMIRRKNKIKVGFIVRGAAEWCGDDLYKFFEQDKRFEVTVFDCLQLSKAKYEPFRRDFQIGVEQLKSHGLNVVAIDDKNSIAPTQDILISLTPYLKMLPNTFHVENLKAATLIAHIPYAFDTATRKDLGNTVAFFIFWKLFAPSPLILKMYEKDCAIGIPSGLYSGYPKTDIFFEDNVKFHFDWKITRPDAKKIIYAPHWSIDEGVKYATFQWNYKFMYDFAKAHPEISWVVKPHPNLMYSAIKSGLFSSVEEFKNYFLAWNNLPNALVYTGAYYQQIFATSDGMIHDSGSFIAEYQYMDKPMIFLFRGTQSFNDLGNEILKVSYVVDGKDLNGIAENIQRVFIEGKDDKAAARRELFDKYLNYPKTNGMLASEFIYKNITDELK